jgi:FlaA1/EpsC-like NDP-sugar epimerase
MVSSKETLTWSKLRQQARANLPEPTTSFGGKTVLMTGATGLICSEAVRILARLHLDTLVLGVRNTTKGDALADELA